MAAEKDIEQGFLLVFSANWTTWQANPCQNGDFEEPAPRRAATSSDSQNQPGPFADMPALQRHICYSFGYNS